MRRRWRANDSPYGLSAGIVTTSLKYASHFKRHSQSGLVMVNLPTAGLDYHVPFGGRKKSSYGPREQGAYAKEFYTIVMTLTSRPEPERLSFCLNHTPTLNLRPGGLKNILVAFGTLNSAFASKDRGHACSAWLAADGDRHAPLGSALEWTSGPRGCAIASHSEHFAPHPNANRATSKFFFFFFFFFFI